MLFWGRENWNPSWDLDFLETSNVSADVATVKVVYLAVTASTKQWRLHSEASELQSPGTTRTVAIKQSVEIREPSEA
jgi:hypothetical protein